MVQAVSWSLDQAAPQADTGALDPARLSDLIGLIYDCVVDPQNWPRALQAVCDEFSLHSGMISMGRLAPMHAVLQYTVGVDPDWAARIPDYMPDIIALWGGVERIQNFPLDEPIVNSQVVGPEIQERNAYAREWRKRGADDAAVFFMSLDPALVGSIGFNTRQGAGPLTIRELADLRLLGPHFRRAVTISNLFDLKALEAATFASVIDAFSCGLLLIDERQGVVHANPAAAAMFESRDPIELRKGSLHVRDKDAASALERALHAALSAEATLGARGIGIPTRRADGTPCVIHLLPLTTSGLRSRFGQRARAALFVVPAATPIEAPMAALTLLYDLTPAEARICELLVRGSTQRAIARKLGIAPSTVKTHVLRLYAKTGRKRLSDLVALAHDLALPL